MMRNFRTHITETNADSVCEMFSEKGNPFRDLTRSLWANKFPSRHGAVLRFLDQWSEVGRSDEDGQMRIETARIMDILQCPNRAEWSMTQSSVLFRGVWRTMAQMKNTTLTNRVLFPVSGLYTGDNAIFGTMNYKSRIPLHSWSSSIGKASPFSGGAHVRRPTDTVRMIMRYTVQSKAKTLDLDMVSRHLGNSGESEVIVYEGSDMKVDFVAQVKDIGMAIAGMKAGGKPASDAELKSLLVSALGEMNARTLMNNENFKKAYREWEVR